MYTNKQTIVIKILSQRMAKDNSRLTNDVNDSSRIIWVREKFIF